MKNLYIPFLLLFPAILPAQQFLAVHKGCSYDGEENASEYYAFESSAEADRIVLEIVDALGLEKNFVVRSSNVQNALATTTDGKRYILYSTTFLEKFKADANTRWAAYSVLAHEIGHHLNGHDFTQTDPRKRKLMELEADGFSGSVLRMLGAKLTESQAGIESFRLQGETNTHPAPAARREAIASGWKKRDEWLRERGMTAAPARREETKPTTTPPTASHGNPGDFSKERCQLCPEMVLVEGGSFTMGCTEEQGSDCSDNEKPAHQVTLPGFYIGKYEVTQAEWRAIIGNNPSENKDCDRCPVEKVSWEDVQTYILKLNQQTGKNFRLPSEAEWEYAARGGQLSKGYKYAGDSRNLGLVAWWYGNSGRKTHPVGERKANELGIYDMSGSVWEFCADDWHDNYLNAPTSGIPWQTPDANRRILRGGSWYDYAKDCRSSGRFAIFPKDKFNGGGFRLVHGL